MINYIIISSQNINKITLNRVYVHLNYVILIIVDLQDINKKNTAEFLFNIYYLMSDQQCDEIKSGKQL